MGDEFSLRKRFQHGVEALEAAVENPVARGLGYVSEVDLDGHVQFRGERVHTLHLGAIALHLILNFAEAERAALNGFRQQIRRFGLSHIGTDKPHEAARMFFGERPGPVHILHAC